MLIRDLLEGGWDTTATQSTVIKPSVVKAAMAVIHQFTDDLNKWLVAKKQHPVKVGKPLGSSAYYEVDTEDKIYGDIDLQMIAAPVQGTAYNQFTSYWNNLADQFVKETKPAYVLIDESKPGHPILNLGKDLYVQVDFMWHEPKMSNWGAARATPERGIKGLLFGNMFSVLGELLNMSIQHAGVQFKTQNGVHVPFSKQKDTQVHTVSIDPHSFVLDIFHQEAKNLGIQHPKVDPLLKQFPGNNTADVKISNLVNSVKGLAKSFEANGMFGHGTLQGYTSADDFVAQFVSRYEAKAMDDVNNKKRDKAATPEAIARAEADRQKVLNGLATVKSYFAS
jgi:hypothetical protein